MTSLDVQFSGAGMGKVESSALEYHPGIHIVSLMKTLQPFSEGSRERARIRVPPHYLSEIRDIPSCHGAVCCTPVDAKIICLEKVLKLQKAIYKTQNVNFQPGHSDHFRNRDKILTYVITFYRKLSYDLQFRTFVTTRKNYLCT